MRARYWVQILCGATVGFAAPFGYATASTVERLTALCDWHATQPSCAEAVIHWIQHIRVIVPLQNRPIPIDLLDQLTAQDIRFIHQLTQIAQDTGYLSQRPNQSPKLTSNGKQLFKQAEELILPRGRTVPARAAEPVQEDLPVLQ